MNEIVRNYKIDDPDFTEWAHEKVQACIAAMPPSKSNQDPNRLGTQSVLYSKIKNSILELLPAWQVNGRDAGVKEFNEMESLKEQLKFQALARKHDTHPWVLYHNLLPGNLRDFHLAFVKANRLRRVQAASNNEKLREETEEIDGDRLLEKLMPFLQEGKRNARAAAVLLATGRRTTEVLLTGELFLDKEKHSLDGYACMFKGQLKAGLDGDEPYEIPLLAPYNIVKAAWDTVRELFPPKMNEEETNSSYAKTLHQFTTRMVDMNPHKLRACYALMTFQLQVKKISLIGHIGKVLGHSSPKSSTHYQNMEIVNFSGPWGPKRFEAPEPEEVENSHGWDLQGRAEEKRLERLLEMQEKRIKITASSIRTWAGSSTGVAQRILERNRDLVDKYNATL